MNPTFALSVRKWTWSI